MMLLAPDNRDILWRYTAFEERIAQFASARFVRKPDGKISLVAKRIMGLVAMLATDVYVNLW